MSDQSEVIEFLSSPLAFENGSTVDTVETHGAVVFLCGDTALKLKRAVTYDYMDLSTIDQRHKMLLREIALNAPQAPMIYRDVLAVTKDPSGYRLGGDGPVVDWVLRMWRFPEDCEFENIVSRGALDDALSSATGDAISAYHASAPVIRREGDTLVRDIIDELSRVFAEFPDAAGTEDVKPWLSEVEQAFARVCPVLAQRGRDGHVKRAHGDLHLRNIVLIDGRPVLFDALEFDEDLGTCDVLYDIAFLVMDLCHRGLRQQACRVLDAWLSEARGKEDAGLVALPLFLSIRAAIRAMVLLQTDAALHAPGASRQKIKSYLGLARISLRTEKPRLVAVGGYSGTGKSAFAAALAPSLSPLPGAVTVSSDVERKAGLPKKARLPSSDYASNRRDAVYAAMLARAEALLHAGQSVLLDATFLSAHWRDEAERTAARVGVPFEGVWLEAPQAILEDRLRTRPKGASDAGLDVLRAQIAAPLEDMTWQRLDAAKPVADMVADARALLRLDRGDTQQQDQSANARTGCRE
jgi:aminoglycoside phosphotransferase family enzyme/gluconate kinase